jgi:hypothetical protein
MKKLSILAMIVGFLTPLSSVLFKAIYSQQDRILAVFYWLILAGFEFFFSWVYLFSASKKLQLIQKLTLVALIGLTGIWFFFVFNNADEKSIFAWALKTLNYSGLYFVGVFIYYRETSASSSG